jgi:hypothetical protein
MFYSTELLQRRSPLGFVWGAAHGRKLARGRILKVNIGETWYASLLNAFCILDVCMVSCNLKTTAALWHSSWLLLVIFLEICRIVDQRIIDN